MAALLIYGFEPFRHYKTNITQRLIQALPPLAGVATQVLPVVFDEHVFSQCFEAHQPDFILGLGQYPRGQRIRIERKFYNQKKDRAHNLDQPIVQADWESDCVNWKIPTQHGTSRVTYDAGRYVCNFSMAMGMAYAQQTGTQYGFLHIPLDFELEKALGFIDFVLAGVEASAASCTRL